MTLARVAQRTSAKRPPDRPPALICTVSTSAGCIRSSSSLTKAAHARQSISRPRSCPHALHRHHLTPAEAALHLHGATGASPARIAPPKDRMRLVSPYQQLRPAIECCRTLQQLPSATSSARAAAALPDLWDARVGVVDDTMPWTSARLAQRRGHWALTSTS